MKRTGSEIVELIQKYNLNDVECFFSLPGEVYQNQHRERKFRTPTPGELYDIYERYYAGEKLADIAKEYNANPSYVSSRKGKALARREKIRRTINEKPMA
jgi:Mor family transcriptional regulator